MDKITRLNKTIPKIYNPLSNNLVKGLLEAWAQEFEVAAQQIANAKDEMLLSTSDGIYLERIGLDRGVTKPILIALSDIYFKNLIVKMSYTPKQIRKTMYDVLDIFWGPTYSRANITSTIGGTFDIGTPFGLTGTISFVEDDIIVTGTSTLFTTELAVNDFIKLSTDDNSLFFQVTRIIDDTSLVIGEAPSASYSGSGVALTPYILEVSVDGGDTQEILINPSYFSDTNACTVDEMVESLNDNDYNAIFSNVSVVGGSDEFLNLRTGTLGLLGKIQVVGGTANTLFSFNTAINTIYDLENSTIICEVNPREIVLLVPNLVGNLERELYGSAHIHTNTVITISSVDSGTLIIEGTHDDRNVLEDEFVGKTIAGSIASATITANTAATAGNTISFTVAGDTDIDAFIFDLSGDAHANIVDPNYNTSFIYNPKISYDVTGLRTKLTEAIVAGESKHLIQVEDAADIPNSNGFLCFDFGGQNQENLVPYISRPNNSILEINSSYVFKKSHDENSVINYIIYGAHNASKDPADDFAAYLTDTVSTLEFVQNFIDLIKASGVILRWIIDYPEYRF